MKNSLQNAKRWLKQAEYDFGEAEKLLRGNDFSYACFFAEQAAQKSLKAFLFWRGKRFVAIHSVGALLEEASLLDPAFGELIGKGKKLDHYYLASRYPDALPEPAIPSESYVKEDAEGAITIAGEILNRSREIIGDGGSQGL